jgi:hypothetical protein
MAIQKNNYIKTSLNINKIIKYIFEKTSYQFYSYKIKCMLELK